MPKYIIAYHGGEKPETPEEGAEQMAKWKDWVAGLGAAAVNPGTPLMNARMITREGVSDDVGPDAMHGFSVVNADSIDEALKLAQDCPYLEINGNLLVAEMIEMDM